MKYRIIKSFLAVSFSVCILYSSVKTAYHNSILSASNRTVENPTSPDTDTSIQNHTQENSEKNRFSRHHKENITENDTDNNDTADNNTENTEIEETNPDAPSLNEYLSNLTCGGCGRNCPLINPRCHNGMRKARQATEAYYAAYDN